MSESSRRQFNPKLVLLPNDQIGAIQQDADTRYPERHGPTQRRRNFNPALRDGIRFWFAHYSLFLVWITTNGDSTAHEDVQP